MVGVTAFQILIAELAIDVLKHRIKLTVFA